MKKQAVRILIAFLIASSLTLKGFAADTEFAGNYIVPEYQSGFSGEQYEVQAGRKLQRGAENFFLSPMEIFHGVKLEYVERKQEYLPLGVEHFFLGLVRGIGRGFVRAGVGLYEIFTFPYPQGPIIEELDDWLY